MRDGVSLTQHRQMRPLALPSEIMRLENLHGYLKFPGPFPVTEIKLRYVDRPASAERFIPRKDAPHPERNGYAGGRNPGPGNHLY